MVFGLKASHVVSLVFYNIVSRKVSFILRKGANDVRLFVLSLSTQPMKQESIEDLIGELKELRLREAEVIERLESANRRQAEGKFEAVGLERSESTLGAFVIGDRVVITNKIRKPASCNKFWTPERERKAIVTGIDGEKVHIKTDNGIETWRLTKNLKRK